MVWYGMAWHDIAVPTLRKHDFFQYRFSSSLLGLLYLTALALGEICDGMICIVECKNEQNWIAVVVADVVDLTMDGLARSRSPGRQVSN